VLVADDEKPARERLQHLLKRQVRVELVRSCAGGAEVLAAVEDAERARRPVHILFLDVQMPELDGFGVISTLVGRHGSEILPVVVFVTAHDEYALRAFEAHAIDYLLKPFSDERFDATLDRAVRQVKADLAHTLMSQMQALLNGVALAPPRCPRLRRNRRSIGSS
jgi:two-component system, LytTR family, response regulator